MGFRPLNLLLILGVHKLTQWVMIKDSRGLYQETSLLELRHGLDQLMWASLILATAGYIINDYYDQPADRINKPEKTSNVLIKNPAVFWSIWAGLNLLAFTLGFNIDAMTKHTNYGALFIGISAVLWGYNLSKWSKFFIGPLLISLFVSLNLVLVQDFVLNGHSMALVEDFSIQQTNLDLASKTHWIWRIAFLGFITNFIREIIKDIEDINGDQNAGRHTIPIILGIERTAKIATALGIILILSLGTFTAIALNSSIPLSVNLTLVMILALWITFKSAKIEQPSQAKSLSLKLKLLLALGLLCLFWL